MCVYELYAGSYRADGSAAQCIFCILRSSREFGSLQVLFRKPYVPLPAELMSTCGALPWARTMRLRSARCLPIHSFVTGGRPRFPGSCSVCSFDPSVVSNVWFGEGVPHVASLCRFDYMDVAYYLDLKNGPPLPPLPADNVAGGVPPKARVPLAVLCPVFNAKRCDKWFFGYPLFYFFADVMSGYMIGAEHRFASRALVSTAPVMHVPGMCRHAERPSW